MPILEAKHDRGHPIEDDPHWSESYYFNAYAPESDVGFFSRIGIRPNEPYADGFMTLWLPGGGTAHLVETRERGVPDVGEPVLQGLRFEGIRPLDTWHVVANGRSREGHLVRVDATFRALSPAIGVDATRRAVSHATGTSVTHSLAAGHFEQAGAWDGELFIDGERYPLSGRGNRDKSWGPRRTDGGRGMRSWRWFSMNFGDSVHAGGIKVGTDSGNLERGWLFSDGVFASIRGWDIQTEYDDAGSRQRRVSLVALERSGKTHAIEGEVLRTERIHARGHEHMAIFEGLTRWSYQGQTGYGICEYADLLDADREVQA